MSIHPPTEPLVFNRLLHCPLFPPSDFPLVRGRRWPFFGFSPLDPVAVWKCAYFQCVPFQRPWRKNESPCPMGGIKNFFSRLRRIPGTFLHLILIPVTVPITPSWPFDRLPPSFGLDHSFVAFPPPPPPMSIGPRTCALRPTAAPSRFPPPPQEKVMTFFVPFPIFSLYPPSKK